MDFINIIENIVKSQRIFHSILEGNEAQTRWLLIDPFLIEGLQYDRKDIIVEFSLNQEDRVSKYDKIDYCILINNEPRILVEAKSLGTNIFEKFSQLENYFNTVVKEHNYENRYLIGILTDGDLLLFYTNTEELKMDKDPFYTIRLSESEDFERQKLLNYSKSRMKSMQTNINIILPEDEYFYHTEYRIDSILSAIDYFNSKHEVVEIESVYLKGVLNKKIKSYKALYKTIIQETDKLKPDLLYQLAQQEFKDANGTIANLQFSLTRMHSSDLEYDTKFGSIYISQPSTDKGYIDRIIMFCKVSGFGLHNIMISLRAVS